MFDAPFPRLLSAPGTRNRGDSTPRTLGPALCAGRWSPEFWDQVVSRGERFIENLMSYNLMLYQPFSPWLVPAGIASGSVPGLSHALYRGRGTGVGLALGADLCARGYSAGCLAPIVGLGSEGGKGSLESQSAESRCAIRFCWAEPSAVYLESNDVEIHPQRDGLIRFTV